jgi:hypothetical protein
MNHQYSFYRISLYAIKSQQFIHQHKQQTTVTKNGENVINIQTETNGLKTKNQIKKQYNISKQKRIVLTG